MIDAASPQTLRTSYLNLPCHGGPCQLQFHPQIPRLHAQAAFAPCPPSDSPLATDLTPPVSSLRGHLGPTHHQPLLPPLGIYRTGDRSKITRSPASGTAGLAALLIITCILCRLVGALLPATLILLGRGHAAPGRCLRARVCFVTASRESLSWRSPPPTLRSPAPEWHHLESPARRGRAGPWWVEGSAVSHIPTPDAGGRLGRQAAAFCFSAPRRLVDADVSV